MNFFNRVKRKDRKFGVYPCSVYLHNALKFIENCDFDAAYEEICWALLKAGDTLSGEEEWRFRKIQEIREQYKL